MHNSVDIVEDISEDKRVEIMLKEDLVEQSYPNWMDFLIRPPFYHGENKEEIKNILAQLCDALAQGDSCVEYTDCPVEMAEICHHFCGELPVQRPLVWDAPYLYLQRYWAMEYRLAQRVASMAKQPMKAVASTQFLHLLDDFHQQQALIVGLNAAFAMITGGPGTGKTHVLARIVAVLKKLDPTLRIAMAAPTGKAAQRMQEALSRTFSDSKLLEAGLYHEELATQQTQTLHRLLGMGHQQVPRYHQKNPLPYDVVVVDEASMLDLNLAQALFAAIQPPTRLILLGDANQLSSVDVGYVLADLHCVPELAKYQVALVHSRRFSDDAQIGRFAKFIYAQEQPTFAAWQATILPHTIQAGQDFTIALAEEEQEVNLPKDWVGYYSLPKVMTKMDIHNLYQTLAKGFESYVTALSAYAAGSIDKQQLSDAFDHYRILVVMRYFDLGLAQINQAMTTYLKDRLNIVHEGEWFYGRPIMITMNDYQLGLSNGDIGICLQNRDDENQYSVYFPSLNKDIAAARLPQSVQTAFAMTIHKSQGSEFRHTAVVLDARAEQLLSKELLYTAITRAKKMVSIYSSDDVLEKSMLIQTQRKSGLVQQIVRQFE